jgi:hypothetical protein
MSLGRQKNLIVLGAVAAALLVAGVLVADYADILPGRAKAYAPVKACQSGEAKPCCAAKGDVAAFAQVVAATTEVAPAVSGCGSEKSSGCSQECGQCELSCEKPCPAECPKPCCQEKPPCCEKPLAGCCEEGQPGEAAAGCCAAKADADGATE